MAEPVHRTVAPRASVDAEDDVSAVPDGAEDGAAELVRTQP